MILMNLEGVWDLPLLAFNAFWAAAAAAAGAGSGSDAAYVRAGETCNWIRENDEFCSFLKGVKAVWPVRITLGLRFHASLVRMDGLLVL